MTGWKVFFHDDFDAEFNALSEDVQDELLAAAKAVQRLGPAADRPHVGTLNNPKHPNMKELRFKANNGAEVWRAAFALDPDRHAIILVAADKQGIDEKKFYKDLLKLANRRFDQHLKDRIVTLGAETKAAAGSTKVKQSKAKTGG